jgi:hypothetical protein
MLNRQMKRKAKKYGGGVFRHDGKIYSISDRNKYGEYVVIKLEDDVDGVTQMVGTCIIKANDLKGVQAQIEKYPFEMFKQFDKNGLQ